MCYTSQQLAKSVLDRKKQNARLKSKGFWSQKPCDGIPSPNIYWKLSET